MDPDAQRSQSTSQLTQKPQHHQLLQQQAPAQQQQSQPQPQLSQQSQEQLLLQLRMSSGLNNSIKKVASSGIANVEIKGEKPDQTAQHPNGQKKEPSEVSPCHFHHNMSIVDC